MMGKGRGKHLGASWRIENVDFTCPRLGLPETLRKRISRKNYVICYEGGSGAPQPLGFDPQLNLRAISGYPERSGAVNK
ncbi:MAG: hypothetical protein DMG85_17245 [Acidobacteria bacterium]|nr:MAG: hypothetical protein DMG85_17245 [Acidobacteriota bacterium]